jgi:amino acid adenylation domain-containing protein
MNEVFDRLSDLSLEKRELVLKKLKERGLVPTNDGTMGNLPIVPVERDHPLPLSFSQQRLWFIDQWDPGQPYYNIPGVIRLLGRLDVPVLERSLNEIIRRHEVLRTTFMAKHGHPVQMIAPVLEVPIPEIDLAGLPEADRERHSWQLICKEAQRAFVLSQDALIRALVFHLDGAEHLLLLNMHHIVSDAWSIGIFTREMATLYGAFSTGAASPLPGLPIQYADFAVWQRQCLQGDSLDQLLAYWKEHLKDASLLDLPADRPRPPLQTYRGATSPFDIPNELVEGLEALARGEGATLFMILLAAFGVLLYRYTEQECIVIGSPIAGRGCPELEDLIGFFVNALALEIDLSGNPTFLDLVARVREMTLDAYAHQDLPFERLVAELQLERDVSKSPLFQVVFAFQNAPVAPLELPGLTVCLEEFDSGTVRFDLEMHVWERQEGLKGVIAYNVDLFEPLTISCMIGHFKTLLQCIIARPHTRISDLAILTADEMRQLLFEWNDTAVDYPGYMSVHHLFAMQARERSEAIAVVFGDLHITYGELEARANQVAHRLRAQGVGPESLVGICLERSADLVVAILGILKAGGAYVPLDPTYPEARLSFMLEDTCLSILLTHTQLLPRIPESNTHIVCLDAAQEEIAVESRSALLDTVTADGLAYVMYTSGSTGKPKGVSVVHRGIVRLVKETSYVTIDSQDVFLFLSSASFDAATFEIWGSLLNGARLVIMPDGELSLSKINDTLQKERVSVLWLTAGLFHLIVQEQIENLSSVKQLLAGGDVLSVPHARKVLQSLKSCVLINGYGPTENTTFSCCCRMNNVNQIGWSVSIGRPISNTRVYVLDRYLNPVPVGVPGELFVGGDGLARGYLNRPGLTAERFIPNPFGDIPGARLYRTGDSVRYLSNGDLEFIGRFDYQVKIRGFRVELGEIESLLVQNPTVCEAVVVVRGEISGDERLVAYVILDEGCELEVDECLSAFLKQKLPGYMLPSTFVTVEAFPLSPNGKIDRKSLPEPVWNHRVEEAFVSPSDSVEKEIAKIYADVLGLERVGVYGNFFALGGHSLLATQVASRIEVAFQVTLPLRMFFESPTVAGVAQAVKTLIEEGNTLTESITLQDVEVGTL